MVIMNRAGLIEPRHVPVTELRWRRRPAACARRPGSPDASPGDGMVHQGSSCAVDRSRWQDDAAPAKPPRMAPPSAREIYAVFVACLARCIDLR